MYYVPCSGITAIMLQQVILLQAYHINLINPSSSFVLGASHLKGWYKNTHSVPTLTSIYNATSIARARLRARRVDPGTLMNRRRMINGIMRYRGSMSGEGTSVRSDATEKNIAGRSEIAPDATERE